MPGRIPSEIVRDSFGQVWIVTMNDDRHLFPDWETYIMVGGDPTFASLREVDPEELRESRAHGLTGSLTDRLPDRLMEPSARVRSIETGATNGPVEVPAGSVNLALGRPAEMGTTGAGGAPLAVDGDTRGMRADATMAASDGEQFGPWWQVDLGEVQPVSYVQVWPSVDGCCGEQLNNFLVFTSDRKFDSVEVRKVQRQRGVADLFVLGRAGLPTTVAIDRRVRFVRVQVARSSTLDLAEVMVWSDPSAGRSGR
jgi:hypothetical protein